jgi:type II secretory pathway pseudopilin PulG
MKKLQEGFSALEALLVVIIVGMLGGVGYYVWHSQQQADKTYSQTANSSVAPKKTATPSKSTAINIIIKEWGVQGKYSGLVNLQYKTDTSVTAPQSVALTSRELANSKDKTCSEENSAGGVISRYTLTEHYLVGDSGEDSGQTAAAYASTLKKGQYRHLGDYYYFYTGIQGVCSPDKALQDLQGQTHDAVLEVLASLEAVQ